MSHVDMTLGEFSTQLVDSVLLRHDDPLRLFMHWLSDNSRNGVGLYLACQTLGIDPPMPGPRLFRRLYEVVSPVLVQRSEETE